MNPQLLKKDFVLQTEWNAEVAPRLDRFLELLTKNQIAIRTGTYLGTGRELVVPVPDLPSPPVFLVLQPAAGGTPHVTLVPYPTGEATTWNRKSFTLKAASTYNTMNTTYTYLVLA